MPGNVTSHQPCGLSSGGRPWAPRGKAFFLADVYSGVTMSPGVTWLGFSPDFSTYELCELGLVT